jgi:alpha-glucosidase (family GH31 glycosyl hydrolase)
MKIKKIISTLCLAAFLPLAGHSIGAPESGVIIDGKARFTVLSPTLIRTEYTGDGVFEDRSSFNTVDRQLPVPEYTTTEKDGWREIQTEKIQLRYKQNSGAFDTTNLVVALNVGNRTEVAKPWSKTAIPSYREEAENAKLLGGAWLATDHQGYTGSGFAAGLKILGAGLEWTTGSNLKPGEYTLSLKYSSGKGEQTISLYIDGVKTQITLPATTDWEEWKIFRKTITLDFGRHTFNLMCDDDDTWNVNIDWIHLTPFLDINQICEAEDALMTGNVNRATDHTGFSGSGFAAGYKATGDAVAWDFNSLPAGNYTISLKYANGIPGSDNLHKERTLSLYVDNTKIQQLTFPITADWDTWGRFQHSLFLAQGAHTIQIRGDAGDSQHLNFDWLILSPAGADLPEENIAAGKNNLGAWSRGLDTKNGAIPLWDGILSRDGWYLLDDSEAALWNDDWLIDRPIHLGGYQDGYLFGYGTDYQAALKDFYSLTGNPLLLPKWAFGVWYSINSENYTNAAYYQNTLLPQFREDKIPLDVLVVDTDWKAPDRWNSWDWNTANFPNPQAFLDWTRQQGLVVPLNVHPTIQNNDPKFTQANAVAEGLIPGQNNRYHFDWSNRNHAKAYFDLLQPFNDLGIRFWWNDQAEAPRSQLAGAPADTWINHLYVQDALKRNLRGFAFSRTGSGDTGYDDNRKPGTGWSEHRYTLHFTGDAYDTWNMLAFQSTFTIREANIGIPYVSHDLGSYHGGHLSDDMYMRWIQFGTFQPIFRLHSKRGDRLPRQYPNVKQEAENFIRLRHALVPYTYTLAREASTGGLPIVRGMYWYYPEAEEAYSFDRQYFYGEKLLVAPIASPGARASVQVWFPEGRWTDWFTGETVTGPTVQTVSAGYATMPVFVKAGGIIPLAPNADYAGQSVGDSLLLKVYAGSDGTFSLYEDEGENLNFLQGNYALTVIEYSEQERKLSIKARQGDYAEAPESRSYNIALYNAALPGQITVNGIKMNTMEAGVGEGWRADGDVIYILLNRRPVTADIEIVLEGYTSNLTVDPEACQGVKLFPNPATGSFLVEWEAAAGESRIGIYNAAGKKVYDKGISNSRKTTLNARMFDKGTYLVKIDNEKGTFTGKLIIK